MELEALSAIADRFSTAGAPLVLNSPQLPEHNAAIAKEKDLAGDILSDPGNVVAASYGLKYQMPDEILTLGI
jgi:peroxiredoxin